MLHYSGIPISRTSKQLLVQVIGMFENIEGLRIWDSTVFCWLVVGRETMSSPLFFSDRVGERVEITFARSI